MVTRKNWLESAMKWRNIVQSLEESGHPTSGGFGCGFCDQYLQEIDRPSDYPTNELLNEAYCSTCPLFDLGACANIGIGKAEETTYWKYNEARLNGDLVASFKYAKELLEVIESLEPKRIFRC